MGAARDTSHLANEVLALERADAAEADSVQKVVDLSTVTAGSAGHFQGRCMAADVALHVDGAALVLLELVDEVMLCEAISNLIDNAFRHAGSALSPITLTLRTAPEQRS